MQKTGVHPSAERTPVLCFLCSAQLRTLPMLSEHPFDCNPYFAFPGAASYFPRSRPESFMEV